MRQRSDVPVSLDKDFVTHVLAGKAYHLCCTWRALRIASVLLKSQGISVSLMTAVDFRDLRAEMVVPLFYAMAVQQHPGLTYEDLVAKITLATWDEAASAVAEAYQQAMPEPEATSSGGSHPASEEMSEADAWLHWTAVAQIDLGLSLKQLEEMTPRYFHYLRERRRDLQRHSDFMLAQIRAGLENFSMMRGADWRTPMEFMPTEQKQTRTLRRMPGPRRPSHRAIADSFRLFAEAHRAVEVESAHQAR